MEQNERAVLIDQLDRSFKAMPEWIRDIVMHGLAAPTNDPATGKTLTTFREVLEAAHDDTLEILLDDFGESGDLLPAI